MRILNFAIDTSTQFTLSIYFLNKIQTQKFGQHLNTNFLFERKKLLKFLWKRYQRSSVFFLVSATFYIVVITEIGYTCNAYCFKDMEICVF